MKHLSELANVSEEIFEVRWFWDVLGCFGDWLLDRS